jgi:hypothetical protein
MPQLSAHAIVRVWEAGLAAGPLERALLMLGVACPDVAPDEIQSLPVGARDARLFRVHEDTFGSRLQAHAECASCGERVEFALEAGELLQPPVDPTPSLRVLDAGPFQIRYRLITTRDLLAARTTGADDLGTALARSSVQEATREGVAIDATDVPDEVLHTLEDAIADADPNADLNLKLACAKCGTEWEAPFDIVSILWKKVAVEAQRLITQVHLLARAYGWRETDVFAMSAVRRRAYLNLLGQ